MTDHRIGLTLHQLDLVMESHPYNPVVDALITHYQAERWKNHRAGLDYDHAAQPDFSSKAPGATGRIRSVLAKMRRRYCSCTDKRPRIAVAYMDDELSLFANCDPLGT